MQRVEASLAAIIASTMPLLVALLGRIFLGQRIRPLGIAGLLAGIAGVAIIMGSRLSGGVSLPGVILCGIGALSLAAATLTVRGASAGGNILMIVGLQMFVGAAILAAVSLATETLAIRWTPRLVLAFAYTTLVPGLLATWVWFRLVARIGAVRAATYHFLNPFFGVLVASALLGESLGPADLIGVAIVGAGILAVQMAKMRDAPLRTG
ncbi:MAG: DMT family transporter, partial [Albidovulum sp.]